jgi:MinD-like ATPase involved in chromosome partitioning or flagellar assembly/ActR/RegA family two-component response regulator
LIVIGSNLLLIEPDEKTRVFMHHMLSRAGYQVQVAPSGKEGLIIAWRDLPEIIVTEMDLSDIEAVEFIQKLRRDKRTERTLIIGLSHLSDPRISAAGMEAGLDHFIVKQADAVEMLLSTLRQKHAPIDFTGEPAPEPSKNKVIAFLGSKGGIGTSSLCLNTAHHIGLEVSPESTLVCDLVLPLGSLRWITGARDTLNLFQFTQLNSDEISQSYLNEALIIPQGWSFRLLAGVISPEEAESVNADRITPLLQFLRTQYENIIIDLGRNLSPLARVVMAQADQLIIVLQADEEGVSNSLAIREFLETHGIEPDRIWFVSNRPLPSEGMSTEAVISQLGDALAVAVPNMREQMALVNMLHAPLQLRFPEERVNLTLKRLAHHILEGKLEPHPTSEPYQ